MLAVLLLVGITFRHFGFTTDEMNSRRHNIKRWQATFQIGGLLVRVSTGQNALKR